MNARSTSRGNVRPTFFCAGARDPSGSLGGPPLNAADGQQAARLLERCAAGPHLLTEVERPVFVGLDDRLGSFAHCRIFESGRSAAILLRSLVKILTASTD